MSINSPTTRNFHMDSQPTILAMCRVVARRKDWLRLCVTSQCIWRYRKVWKKIHGTVHGLFSMDPYLGPDGCDIPHNSTVLHVHCFRPLHQAQSALHFPPYVHRVSLSVDFPNQHVSEFTAGSSIWFLPEWILKVEIHVYVYDRCETEQNSALMHLPNLGAFLPRMKFKVVVHFVGQNYLSNIPIVFPKNVQTVVLNNPMGALVLPQGIRKLRIMYHSWTMLQTVWRACHNTTLPASVKRVMCAKELLGAFSFPTGVEIRSW